jgi:hypothetical protein
MVTASNVSSCTSDREGGGGFQAVEGVENPYTESSESVVTL